MEYNVCSNCGANGGRAGNLIANDEHEGYCMNCNDTLKRQAVCLHAHLKRTDEEIQKTFALLDLKRRKEN